MGLDLHSDDYMTCQDIEKFADVSNIVLKSSVTGGLTLTVEAFVKGEEDLNDPKPIGNLWAFIRPVPFRLFHLDTIQVKNRRQTLGFRREGWSMSGPGISFIMGSWALRWAYDRGCRETELLAVKDSENMHQILMKLYGSFGFRKVRDVGDDSASIGDRLVWGAVGTLMSMNLDYFFRHWTPKLAVMMKSAKRSTESE
jgi:hypothetical protein